MTANLVFDLVLVPIIAAFYGGVLFAGYLVWKWHKALPSRPLPYRKFTDYQIQSMLHSPPTR